MKKAEFLIEVPPTYVTVKYKGKEREMRRFGECNLLDHMGKVVRQIRAAEYLYVYRDGKNKLEFTREAHRESKKKKGVQNDTYKQSKV